MGVFTSPKKNFICCFYRIQTHIHQAQCFTSASATDNYSMEMCLKALIYNLELTEDKGITFRTEEGEAKTLKCILSLDVGDKGIHQIGGYVGSFYRINRMI